MGDPRRGLLEGLFESSPVVVESACLPAEAPAIDPGEARLVATAGPRRQIEFATGRACARRALERLGVRGFVLMSGADRAPAWPPGVVGSITHTGAVPGGICAVAVARARDLLALGLDAEVGKGLSPELWPTVLTPRELRRLEARAPLERGRLARLAFSAKESFYKAQFPLTRQFLGFEDVEIEIDEASRTFEASVLGEKVTDPRLARCRGRFAHGRDDHQHDQPSQFDNDDVVLTGVAIVGAP